MLYDVDFALAGLFFLIVLYIFLTIQYNKETASVALLRKLLFCLMCADFLDIITSVLISYPYHVPLWTNYLLNVMFFELEVICIYLFPRYIQILVDSKGEGRQGFDRVNDIIIWVYAIVCASTPFTHSIFYFDESRSYQHGYLYLLIFLLPLYFLSYSFIRLLQNKKCFNKRQFYSIIGFIVCALSGPGLQMILPGNHIVDFLALSIAAFIIIFGLETPDFVKLEKALSDLEKSQAALEKAVQKAEAADKAKSDFLANMSHEIRTPINAVLGMNELIGRESTEAQIQAYSANVADAGHTLLSLINDILDFSKIEAGHMELVPVSYQMSDLLREVNNLVGIRCKEKDLQFIIRNNPELPNYLYGDEVRIRQILINLLTNAVKYTEKGSVTLGVNFESKTDDTVNLVLAVVDTGIGIKEENLPLLFESFKRIDLENNRKKEGTGLGLNITQSFVELMGGEIMVHSVYGKGSTFVVRIPQKIEENTPMGEFSSDAQKIPENKKKYKPSFLSKGARILVVDDVSLNLKLLQGLLKQTGVLIDTAESGQECMDAITKVPYDMILLDHMMPNMDGIETLDRMKQDKEHPNQTTPVIMLTANAISGAKEEYMNAGFTDYLTKPVVTGDLEAMLVKYLPAEKVELQ